MLGRDFERYYANHGAVIWGGYFTDYHRMDEGGKILLAPNGKPSSLTSHQYKLARTPEFKNWFGDWEKQDNVDRFYNSKTININNNLPYKIEHELKLYRHNIFNHISNNKLGNYVNNHSGIKMRFGRSSLKKIFNHSAIIEIVESLNCIEDMIKDSTYITCSENTDPQERISTPYYHYLFSEIKFKGENYVSYIDVKETRNKADRYVLYDFTLFKVERSELAIRIQLSKHGRLTNPDPLYHKGKKLSLIFDTSIKNILNENGEPKIEHILQYMSKNPHFL